MYARWIKRFLDLMIAIIGLLFFSPLCVFIAIAIRLTSPGPVFFRQKRVGKEKELFRIWKFRTMYAGAPADVPTHLLKDADLYITPIGKALRAASLDELPQLLNVILGHMSLIGPRPALWNQDDLVALRDQYGANAVRPGLSGWAQVNGRDELSLEKKGRRDGEYAQNLSFALDMKCFALTAVKVFNREGIAEGKEGKHYAAHRIKEDE